MSNEEKRYGGLTNVGNMIKNIMIIVLIIALIITHSSLQEAKNDYRMSKHCFNLLLKYQHTSVVDIIKIETDWFKYFPCGPLPMDDLVNKVLEKNPSVPRSDIIDLVVCIKALYGDG